MKNDRFLQNERFLEQTYQKRYGFYGNDNFQNYLKNAQNGSFANREQTKWKKLTEPISTTSRLKLLYQFSNFRHQGESLSKKDENTKKKLIKSYQTWCIPDMVHTRHVAYQTWCIPDILHTRHVAYQTWCIPDMVHTRHVAYQTYCIPDM